MSRHDAGAEPALGSGESSEDDKGGLDRLDDDLRRLDDDIDQLDEDLADGLPSAARAFFDWVVVIAVALLVAMIVKTFLLAHFIVDGESMNSTLAPNDRVFVNKLSYRLHEPNRGDVVVLHEISGATERDLIKRVIALPGETIEIADCQVYIDGFRLDEPYLSDEVLSDRGWCDYAETSVPSEHVFVMGDNRPASADSRSLGPIAYDDLVGRAFVVFWPTTDMKWL